MINSEDNKNNKMQRDDKQRVANTCTQCQFGARTCLMSFLLFQASIHQQPQHVHVCWVKDEDEQKCENTDVTEADRLHSCELWLTIMTRCGLQDGVQLCVGLTETNLCPAAAYPSPLRPTGS